MPPTRWASSVSAGVLFFPAGGPILPIGFAAALHRRIVAPRLARSRTDRPDIIWPSSRRIDWGRGSLKAGGLNMVRIGSTKHRLGDIWPQLAVSACVLL